MPQVTISKPFNYRKGLDVELIKAGKQELSAEVIAYARAAGFVETQTIKPAAPAAAKE